MKYTANAITDSAGRMHSFECIFGGRDKTVFAQGDIRLAENEKVSYKKVMFSEIYSNDHYSLLAQKIIETGVGMRDYVEVGRIGKRSLTIIRAFFKGENIVWRSYGHKYVVTKEKVIAKTKNEIEAELLEAIDKYKNDGMVTKTERFNAIDGERVVHRIYDKEAKLLVSIG